MVTDCRTGASPAIWTGAFRSRRARKTGPAWKARSFTSGSTRPSNTSPARANGPRRMASPMPIGNAGGAPVGAPPAFPIGIGLAMRLGPFARAGDVFDGRVEPDVKDLAFHAGPVFLALLDRNAPVQIAGDAPVLQSVTIVEPFLGDRGGQDGPIGLAVDPVLQLAAHVGLAQVQVLGLAHFQIGRA